MSEDLPLRPTHSLCLELQLREEMPLMFPRIMRIAQRQIYSLTALCLLSTFAPGQIPNASSNRSNDPAAQEREFQIRKENFSSGRQLLLDKGVPFDPDELVRGNWTKNSNLKAALNAMPEMRERRYE